MMDPKTQMLIPSFKVIGLWVLEKMIFLKKSVYDIYGYLGDVVTQDVGTRTDDMDIGILKVQQLAFKVELKR